jgi:hypothetical protein
MLRRLGFSRKKDQWVRACVLASLLAGPQPHRGSLRQAQDAIAQGWGRTREALLEAMGKALDAVTASDARDFFEHRGYRTTAQLL